MSTGLKWAVGIGLLVVLLVVVLVVTLRKPPPEIADTSAPSVVDFAPSTLPATVSPSPVPSDLPVSAETPPTPEPEAVEREYDDVATAEAGLQSMGQSLSKGDSRTPALAEDTPREKPTPDVLNDPAAYEAFESRQSRRIAAGYLSIINQVPSMRARIEQAKITGDMSPEEIAEAEEVVEKILELERDMAAKDPEILNEVRKAGQAPATDQP
jgi:hypothetical protein